MNALLLAVVAVVAAAAPGVQPSPTPLKEIGRVQAMVPCAATLVHANSAIVSTLRNDVTISRAVAHLREVDLNSNVLARKNGLHELDSLAVGIRKEAAEGEGEIKALRQLAAGEPEKSAELKAFADALGGALGRQKQLAIALQRFTTIINGREATWQGRAEGLIPPSRDYRDLIADRRVALETDVFDPPENYTKTAREGAEDFEERVTDIARDEGTAADHATVAVAQGCARRQMSLPPSTR